MKWILRYWWAFAIAVVAIYIFKPGWLKTQVSPGPQGGPVGGTTKNATVFGAGAPFN